VLTEASYFGLPKVLAKVVLQRCLAKAMLV
jgi:hypothetical protein